MIPSRAPAFRHLVGPTAKCLYLVSIVIIFAATLYSAKPRYPAMFLTFAYAGKIKAQHKRC